jgi:hypothetical protein
MLSQNKVFGADSGQLLEEQKFFYPTPFWVLPAGAGTTLNAAVRFPPATFSREERANPVESQNEVRTPLPKDGVALFG